MNDKGNGSRCPPKAYGLNNQQDYYFSLQPKGSDFNVMYNRASNRYHGDEEMRDEDEREHGGVRMIGKDINGDDDNVGEEEYVSDDSDDDDDDSDDDDSRDHNDGKQCNDKLDDVGHRRAEKKRKLRTLISNYVFAPRLPTPIVQKTENSVRDWTEQETFALLDVWGDRFLRGERKSLRAEEWQQVADKVSKQTNMDRSDVQCRNRLDTLKKKYKKEKEKAKVGSGGNGSTEWVYYRKMDTLLSSPPKQQTGLSCGVDSGEFVFTNPDMYLNWANGSDEMKDSPGNSESSRNRKNDFDRFNPKRRRDVARRVENSSSLCWMANSIEKFSDMYEKIESSKRKQMIELEKMRMDFQKQIETQRKLILEKAQAEIIRIRRGCDYGDDLSPENLSG